MLGLKSSLLLNSFKNETSVINELKTTQENLVLQSNNNTSDISDNQSLITTNSSNITTNATNITTNTNSINKINNKLSNWYETLLVRQTINTSNSYLFADKAEGLSCNVNTVNPWISNKYSILGDLNAINDRSNYTFRIKVRNITGHYQTNSDNFCYAMYSSDTGKDSELLFCQAPNPEKTSMDKSYYYNMMNIIKATHIFSGAMGIGVMGVSETPDT